MKKKLPTAILETQKIQLSDSGQRLDTVLSKRFGSRSQAAKVIRQGQIQVNGKLAKPSFLVSLEDLIQIQDAPSEQLVEASPKSSVASAVFDGKSIPIIYEDDQLFVVSKPAGLVVHPAAGHRGDTLVDYLKSKKMLLSTLNGSERAGLVHRLDKETSGLLVLAKTEKAHRNLSLQFQNKTNTRIYFAVAVGKFLESSGRIESILARHPKDRKRFSSVKNQKATKGRQAISLYQVKDFSNGLSLVQLKLETGRTHQIRVHLSELGHVIFGDRTYGFRLSTTSGTNAQRALHQSILKASPHRQFLHAAILGFNHPMTQKEMIFFQDWPTEIQHCLQPLGWSHLKQWTDQV